MSLQNILGDSNSAVRRQMEETKGLVGKWSKTGLLEGIDSEYDRHGMAIMLENQAKQLVTEANSTGTAANSEQWSGVALPLVRRVFAEIAAKDFVSVQPMNLPSGLVFYMDFKYGTAQAGFNNSTAGNTAAQSTPDSGYQNNSVFGVTNTTSDPTGGLYGQGRFGYSINEARVNTYVSASVTPGAASSSIASVTPGLGTDDDSFNYDTKFINAYSGSTAFKKITISSTALTNLDINGARAFAVTASSGISAYFPQFTTVSTSGAGTTISFIVSGSIPLTATAVHVLYQVQPSASTRGDFEDTVGGGTDINIPEINVELKSEAIVAKTRKLKAIWSPEFAQDLNAYHSIDA